MKWSLLLYVSLLVVAPIHYPGVDGGRITRDDQDASDMGLLEKLFNAIMGGNGDKTDSLDSASTLQSTSTSFSTTSPSSTEDTSTNLSRSSTKSTVGTTTTTTTPDGSVGGTQESTTTTTTTMTTTTATTTTTTKASSTENSNSACSKPNDLMSYCNVTNEMNQYLQWDTTTENLISRVFSDSVINQLLATCEPGNWCLSDDYIQAFADSMGSFFSSPMCQEAVINCVDDILYERSGCPDMLKFSALDDSLSLLCEMFGIEELTPECFGHTIATLHVTLADEIRSISKNIEYGDEFCLGPYVGMTRKFMCTLERCPNHDQLFRDFGPWQWFMADAPAIKQICLLDSVCGDKELLDEAKSTTLSTTMTSTTDATWFEEGEEETQTMNDQIDKAGGEETPKTKKPTFIIQVSDESTRLLLGIVTGTLVAILGLMVLICSVIKRMRRRRRFLAKDGYSKLQSEETD